MSVHGAGANISLLLWRCVARALFRALSRRGLDSRDDIVALVCCARCELCARWDSSVLVAVPCAARGLSVLAAIVLTVRGCSAVLAGGDLGLF